MQLREMKTRQSWMSDFAPDAQFAAVVYDDKVHQRGDPGECVGKL